MGFPAWSRIVVDLPFIVYLLPLIPLYRTHSSDGRAACFPNPLTRTFEPSFRCFNELSLLINPGTTQSFSVIHHHTWGLRGASRGRDKLPLVYFSAIVPCRPARFRVWKHRRLR